MSKKGITKTQVQGAIDAIKQQGQLPTNERVRQHLGGTGSYTTINRLIKELNGETADPVAETTPMPADIREIGIKLLTQIYGVCHHAAQARIELHHADAESRVARTSTALVSAEAEIVRLESANAVLDEQVAELRKQELILIERAARAESQLDERQKQLDSSLKSLKTAVAGASKATSEAEQLRGRLLQVTETKPLRQSRRLSAPII